MKRLFLVMFLATATIVVANADPVRGSGKVAYGEFDVSLTYTELSVARGIRIVLVDSNDGVGKIAADEELLQHVSITEREGHVRVTYTPMSINPRSSVETVVTMPLSRNLRDLNASSAGKIVGDQSTVIKAGEVEVDASSAGRIEVAIESRSLGVELSSAANCSLSVACNDVEVDMSSAAGCTIEGHTRNVDVEVSSAAQFHGSELVARHASVQASSGASARVNAAESIRARASSGGSIGYAGNPTHSDFNSSSGGSVRRVD